MSIADIKLFLKTCYPFELLTDSQLNEIIDNTEIVYLKPNQTVLNLPDFYYIILKGSVVEKDLAGNELNYFGEKDSFDYLSIIGQNENQFITVEECIFYRFPSTILLKLISENPDFARYFKKSTKEKLSSIASENPYLFSKVKDIKYQKPLIVESSSSIYEAVKKMTEEKALSIIVKYPDTYGIVTDSDLRKKVILSKKNVEDPIGDIANKNIISVNPDTFLFDAIITMIKHNIKRVVIKDENNQIIGVLNEVDILTQYSNQPQFLALQVERAKSVEELKVISDSMINTVKLLHKEGIRTRHIMKFVSEINEKIFKKLFSLLADESIRENTCLIVMGSEGRQEQILKTDQDNGLILSDNFEFDKEVLENFSKNFIEALKTLGYPECKGNVMLTNPQWRKTLKEFKESIFEYINNITPENMLNLAILIDLRPIEGKIELAEKLREYIFENISDNKTFLSWFALPTINFKTPLNFFGGFETEKGEHKGELDIKKGGIFPIIHGVRSLAAENRITQTNTFNRIKELVNLNVINKDFGRELIESLEFMLTLRLRERLKKIEMKKQPDDYINVNSLTNYEKDLLKESFKVVNKFKDFITNHYKLNYLR
ncbi:putative nucleotidyltransferase substrate binding domain-containing protein [Sulfurihydrogenibium azorense]|uniref:putative nucleotidyltransferase substrate binding domain-containing protein n=1 Tax=Sulfurihydrogenibium azorense TaxID=309806 RepID=UPI002409F1CB|nr:putative nucleotidyltransferase substrate binding domain-containing protein [Sulfurihydrogenibium azorense]MDM7274297.1 putative nucleotidyltransferase substrate binding domain-containing protein [Sulfurihydrogenibium azorense]